jgi:uncharacterized membrane protein YdbT with pleckstrin-like domain
MGLTMATDLLPPPSTNPNGTRIRLTWPTVARVPMIAGLGKMLTRTIILAPLAWLVMGLFYFSKVFPIVGIRYQLTDKKVMIQRGWKGAISQAISLDDIDDVQVDPATIDQFFRSADLLITSGGKTEMTLTAVPDAEAFRHAILSARNAFAPGKVKLLPFVSASATK